MGCLGAQAGHEVTAFTFFATFIFKKKHIRTTYFHRYKQFSLKSVLRAWNKAG